MSPEPVQENREMKAPTNVDGARRFQPDLFCGVDTSGKPVFRKSQGYVGFYPYWHIGKSCISPFRPYFHAECIVSFITDRSEDRFETCPVCKRKLKSGILKLNFIAIEDDDDACTPLLVGSSPGSGRGRDREDFNNTDDEKESTVNGEKEHGNEEGEIETPLSAPDIDRRGKDG